MTRIPPEHPAAKSLEHAFRSLGAERARERRRRRSGRVARLAVAVLAPVLAVAAAATGTKVFTGEGSALHPDRRGQKDPQGRRDLAPADRFLAYASARDPQGGLRWGMRLDHNADGRVCLTVGQVKGRRLGRTQAGQFNEFPSGVPGMCGRFRQFHIIYARRQWGNGPNVLYGAVDRTVQRLRLLRADGADQGATVPIAADGTFIVVRLGATAYLRQKLIADGSGGRTTLRLGPA